MKTYLEADDLTISGDPKTRDALERVFLLLVEELIDINNFFIKEYETKPIDDLKSSFLALGDLGVLPPDFARKISPLAGVRNILVHQYEKIDFDLFLKNLRKNLGDFEVYFGHVLKFLEEN
jgi:uncharacterized protein YutE (UPF0331/DUF86 family)